MEDVPKTVSRGRVRLISETAAYQASFDRFKEDELNGYTAGKAKRCGAEGRVVQVYSDQTVTILFDDGEKLDFPFETIGEQLSVDGPLLPVTWGRVKLHGDGLTFRPLFFRFPEGTDSVNCWSEEKQKYCGSEGRVVKLFGDSTVTLAFDDGKQFDFPFEAVEKQTETLSFKKTAVVRVKSAEVFGASPFQHFFSRFDPSDELNSWSEAKSAKQGMLGVITEVFGDATATLLFEDLQMMDFPFEALEAEAVTNVQGFQFVQS
uniref:Uncharacterized protein n=1 Tax=Chromera velia CCMP2878 TaxID=1169474 RepID=A0A0G4GX15_9ALVE|eukprot:Cvel_23745.t1-p1 / transcript=Cvel_23745.t1 / gene=Cvel_23745 / organism=Chromera_velia_CCMP2878 / gene_product=hypothetical protein / transcript_product=hypothetical protein / location=Cvel_scaffold2486:14815-15597(+) / protein_length=261 / sequence_SO=supercontig / SO=protein_coding / is_pseudo=false